MAARLTDKQKKKIIAEYVSGQSMRALARKYNIAPSTIKRVIDRDPKTKQKAIDKKEQNTEDILQMLYDRKGKVMQIIDLGLEKLLDEEKFNRAGAQAIATTLGILMDKYANLANAMNGKSGGGSELLQSLHDLETRRRDNGD